MVEIMEEVLHRAGLSARIRHGVPELRQLRVPLYESPRDRVACEGHHTRILRAKAGDVPRSTDGLRRYHTALGSPSRNVTGVQCPSCLRSLRSAQFFEDSRPVGTNTTIGGAPYL